MSSLDRYTRWAGRRPSLRCWLGRHEYRWVFVGTSWTPDAYVKACARCGEEPR